MFPESPPTNPATILLVDDTPNNLRILAKILESAGYTTRKSTSGQWALQAAQIDPPDLVLLDINMPNMNGYEVCQQLKSQANTSSIPVIFISALDQTVDKIRAFETGGVDYITKPFQEQEVIARVKTQLLVQSQKRELLSQQQQLEQEREQRQQGEAQIQRLHERLEAQDISRAALQRSLDFESLLRQIITQVRASLDETEILQATVQTLAEGLKIDRCNLAIYSNDHSTIFVKHEFHRALQPLPDRATSLADHVNSTDLIIYQQLLRGQSCQFSLRVASDGRMEQFETALVCPIGDEQSVLGDLWLVKPRSACFSDQEVWLVQQVGQHCAIGLRQARLHATVLRSLVEIT
ncbi:MAG: response regulator [Elainella sp. Prado103]|jgi:DNA-binding response OmpR family regulator|nr:response regulator [Elainella sp. Prado103]